MAVRLLNHMPLNNGFVASGARLVVRFDIPCDVIFAECTKH